MSIPGELLFQRRARHREGAGIVVRLRAHHVAAHGTAVVVLLARGEYEKQVWPYRLCLTTVLAEERRCLELPVVRSARSAVLHPASIQTCPIGLTIPQEPAGPYGMGAWLRVGHCHVAQLQRRCLLVEREPHTLHG